VRPNMREALHAASAQATPTIQSLSTYPCLSWHTVPTMWCLTPHWPHGRIGLARKIIPGCDGGFAFAQFFGKGSTSNAAINGFCVGRGKNRGRGN